MDENGAYILESISDAFVVLDRGWRYTYVNSAAERASGFHREAMLGHIIWELFPTSTELKRALRRAMDERVTVHVEEYYAAFETWIETTIYPCASGVAVCARDVTERHRALREAEERYRTLFNSIDEGFCIIEVLFDEGGRPIDYLFLETNPAFNKQNGLEQGAGKRVSELVPDLEEFWFQVYGRVALTGEPVRLENQVKAIGRWFDVYAFRLGGRESRNVAVLFNNITERKQAEEGLHRAHEQLEQRVLERMGELRVANEELAKEIEERKRAEKELRRTEAYLAEGQRLSHTGSWVWNISSGELYWSAEHYRIFGLDPETTKASYPATMQWMHPEDRSFVQLTFEKAIRERSDFELDCRIVRADGAIRYVHSLAHPVFNESGDLTEYVGTIIDTTERKRAEETLREQMEQLKRAEGQRKHLLRQIVTAQEDERRRIAREMHDQFGQQLSALTVKLAVLKGEYGEQARLQTQLNLLETAVRQLDADIEFLVWELRPTALDDLGLVAALTHYIENWSRHFDIRAELHASGMEKDRLASEIETVLYRVTQEALNNVVKHARAENVAVLLHQNSTYVSLIVEDDGVGFDQKQAFGTGEDGVGLIGMRERTELAGGTLEIEAHPDHGATIIVRIPT